MTEVLSSNGNNVQYYDHLGNEYYLDEYLQLEEFEASRYLAGLESKAKILTPPRTILSLIADQGTPALSDVDIKFKTRFVQHDDAKLNAALTEMQNADLIKFIDTEEKEIPKHTKVPNRPTAIVFNYYSLTVGAYERIPDLAKFTEQKRKNSTPFFKKLFRPLYRAS